MAPLLSLARKHGLEIIEDAAQAFGAALNGRPAGGFGAMNAVSFHETKNISCGEGGALAITDARYVERAEIIRQKGIDRAKFLRGEVDKYSWVDIGSSFVLSELQAAMLVAQLERRELIHAARERIFTTYARGLESFERSGRIRLPRIPDGAAPSYHLFYFLVESGKVRDAILSELRRAGVLAIFHFVPLHVSPMGRKYGYRKGDFPVSEKAGECLIRLPLFNAMTRSQQSYVIRTLRKILEKVPSKI
jgi:dTDP-4-amino-4,6-dideoxygalactose transaminase